jgi:hypothetical protein
MFDLEDKNISYLILSADNINSLCSLLYAKEFNLICIQGYYNGEYEDSVITWSDISNDELRKEAIFLLDVFKQDSAIIKYKKDKSPYKIKHDGSEQPLGVLHYNTDSENKSYLYNGISFSFTEKKRYWTPKIKEDFKKGMVVECNNNGEWLEMEVKNPDKEYQDIYKLFIKFGKIRAQYS